MFTINVAKLYDADGNGTLDLDEFRTMLVNLDDLDPSNVAQFWIDALKVRAERSEEERRGEKRREEKEVSSEETGVSFPSVAKLLDVWATSLLCQRRVVIQQP